MRVSSRNYFSITFSPNECSSLNVFQYFQIGHFEYHDEIVDWLEDSYLEKYSASKSHVFSLVLGMYDNVDKCTFFIVFQGVQVYHLIYQDRIVAWLENSFLVNSFSCRHDLLSFV